MHLTESAARASAPTFIGHRGRACPGHARLYLRGQGVDARTKSRTKSGHDDRRSDAKRRRVVFALVMALLLLLPTATLSQNYPSRNVTVIVPFPPGGSVDGVARILVQKLNETVGQHFIVENRAGGASGIVGATAAVKAPPDGYTLFLSASVHVINPLLYKNVPYDVVNDFTPISLIADGPLIVSTTPSVAANNLKDFFALVRKDPQKFTFGATTIGSASHLAIELLKRDAALDTLVVAYKGTAPALTDLMSGQIQLLADPMLSSLPLARGGQIKALGLTSLKRAAAAPEIPTVEESGVKGFDFVSWYGLWGPKNLPNDISSKLQGEIAKLLAMPDVKERFNLLGFEPIGAGADAFAKYIRDEMAKYQTIINDAKIKIE
ncbi:MAG: tripartite tricarboxylate transporter substrate binding protein [Alphaproteobacteria bacterium]|nr:MAG: tripartite tricarboxylate transporter substrate binding protein [Alphaproteobacteria bacterium]